MITLITSSSPSNPDSTSERHLRSVADAAHRLGIKVLSIGIDNNLDRIEDCSGTVIFSGYIPADYQAIVNKVQEKGGNMINSLENSELLMGFSNWYPLIRDLTAKSIIIESDSDLDQAVAIGFPLFIKGEIKSNKEAGLASCLANDKQELIQYIDDAKKMPITWKNKVIARELLPLRQLENDNLVQRNSFPVSREYRVFLYDDQIIGFGPYWKASDPFGKLTEQEKSEMINLSKETQERLNTRLTIVDLGQLEDLSWKVIEVGDPQFCLFTHISSTSFFNQLLAKYD
jgi:hypothetical protein